MAAVAAIMVAGSPSAALDTLDTRNLAVLSDLVGIEDVSVGAATKYCGNQANGCNDWDTEPGKSGSPTGICKSKSGCGKQGKGKGGKDCICCGRYKDENGNVQDCPDKTETIAIHDAVLSVF